MFNIQRFGDNDTITSSQELSFVAGFVDGDTRTFKLKNPKSGLTGSDISPVDAFITANNILIGDKAGANTNGINSATVIDTGRVKLDLTPDN